MKTACSHFFLGCHMYSIYYSVTLPSTEGEHVAIRLKEFRRRLHCGMRVECVLSELQRTVGCTAVNENNVR